MKSEKFVCLVFLMGEDAEGVFKDVVDESVRYL